MIESPKLKLKLGRELSARFSTKEPEESGDEPRAKQPRPNTPQNETVGDVESLIDKITRVSNNESGYKPYLDIMPSTAGSSSGHLGAEAEAVGVEDANPA